MSFAVATVLAWHGYLKKSLSLSGSTAAFFVGFISMMPGLYFGGTLIAFYLLGSRVTRIGAQQKLKVDGEYPASGQGERDAYQVLCNGGVGSLILLLYLMMPSINVRLLKTAYAAVYGCNVGDTFASELGILSQSDPYLITSMKRVTPGTNGGVSVLGTLAALVGGFTLGCVSCILLLLDPTNDIHWYEILAISTISALLGTTLDSILGSMFQATYRNETSNKIYNSPGPGCVQVTSSIALFSNNQVNLISSCLTAIIISLIHL